MITPPDRWPARLLFYYGWVIIGIAFVTMAISVTAWTAFSLLLPPLITEFGWDRGLAAGAFSFGFLVSAVLSPIVGGATGPWTAGILHDATGSDRPAFLMAMACRMVSAAAICLAAPRNVRLVPGRAPVTPASQPNRRSAG